MVMEVYAMESCLLRAQKASAAKGEASASVMIDAARVFIADAAERLEHEAKRAIAAVHEGDMLTTQIAVLKRFGKRGAVDTIALHGAKVVGGGAGAGSLSVRGTDSVNTKAPAPFEDQGQESAAATYSAKVMRASSSCRRLRSAGVGSCG